MRQEGSDAERPSNSAVCKECSFSVAGEEFTDVQRAVVSHERMRDHQVAWETIDNTRTITVYEIGCTECDFEQTIEDREDAHQKLGQHIDHTEHTAVQPMRAMPQERELEVQAGVMPDGTDTIPDREESAEDRGEMIKNLKALIDDLKRNYEDGVPVDIVVEEATLIGLEPSKAEDEVDKLKQKGEVYEPMTGRLRTT
jgi:hypothetical protein